MASIQDQVKEKLEKIACCGSPPSLEAIEEFFTPTVDKDEDDIEGRVLAQNPFISRPFVTRQNATVKDPTLPSKLPIGIQLTGGAKLREDGLTGKGIRVAVIDSGIDQDHPGFHSKVKQQVWFRWGTPLVKDDHGTHVG